MALVIEYVKHVVKAMKSHDIKIKAGQIWIDSYNSKVTISKVAKVGKDLWAFHKTKAGTEQQFGNLTEDGYPDDWDTDWRCIQDVEDPKPPSPMQNTHNDLLAFFSAVPDGYCACKIEKMHCPYHKDIK